MSLALFAALEAEAPLTVTLTTLTLPGRTVRWTDGGFVKWGDQIYVARDDVYGVVGSISEIEDGADGQATRCSITILPPDATAMVQLASPAVQGSPITIHTGSVDRLTGLMIGDPDEDLVGELDYGRLAVGESLSMVLECGTEEALQLELNADQRLSDSYHQSVWNGELGLTHLTGVTRKIHWTWRR